MSACCSPVVIFHTIYLVLCVDTEHLSLQFLITDDTAETVGMEGLSQSLEHLKGSEVIVLMDHVVGNIKQHSFYPLKPRQNAFQADHICD